MNKIDVKSFYLLSNQLYNQIESKIDAFVDEYDVDIDYEINGNVLAVIFPNDVRIIINTQEPLLQVWMATKMQGYHFEYKESKWHCTRSQKEFFVLFDEALKIYCDIK